MLGKPLTFKTIPHHTTQTRTHTTTLGPRTHWGMSKQHRLGTTVGTRSDGTDGCFNSALNPEKKSPQSQGEVTRAAKVFAFCPSRSCTSLILKPRFSRLALCPGHRPGFGTLRVPLLPSGFARRLAACRTRCHGFGQNICGKGVLSKT